MQIISSGDNFHEISNPVFLGKIREILSMFSAEFFPREWERLRKGLIKKRMMNSVYLIQKVCYGHFYGHSTPSPDSRRTVF